MSEMEGAAQDLSSVEVPDVDAIMDQANQSYEIPMEDPPQVEATPQQAQPTTDSFSFKWNNKDISGNKDQVLKWASMGYDYAQKMQGFNQQRQEFEGKFKPYLEIDEYAKQNPEWWSWVQDQWKTKSSTPGQPQADLPPQFTQKLTEIDSKLNSIFEEKAQMARQQEDSALQNEIQSMRENYKHLDWSKTDEQGHDLELQVLKYASDRGIKNFTDAFRAFNFDRLLSIEREKGKEAIVKDTQKKTKLGLLGNPQAPKRELTTPENIKSKSYNSLVDDALKELGFGA